MKINLQAYLIGIISPFVVFGVVCLTMLVIGGQPIKTAFTCDYLSEKNREIASVQADFKDSCLKYVNNAGKFNRFRDSVNKYYDIYQFMNNPSHEK